MHDFESTLTAARAGAEWAWERLYRELAPAVRGYVRAQGAAEPDDVVGEVFLALVRELRAFSPRSDAERDFRALVFTIAHRRVVDELRRRARRPVAPAPPEVLAEAAGAGGDVTQEAMASLDDARVVAAIAELPLDQRAVLLLRILGDLTVEEVARVVDKRPGAVKALQRRALRRVEKAYPFDDLQR
jgi:RNA polymerase sigma-70 factor (ECF subfamily)